MGQCKQSCFEKNSRQQVAQKDIQHHYTKNRIIMLSVLIGNLSQKQDSGTYKEKSIQTHTYEIAA